MRFELSSDVELRPPEESDADQLYAVVAANRAFLARWMPWAAGQTIDGTREFIASTIGQDLEMGGFQVALVDAGAIAGMLGFHAPDRQNRIVALGYWLAEDRQGRGLMSAAVEALIEHAFSELEMNRVEIRVAPGNARSRALAERLGFTEEGLLREAEAFGDAYRDLVVYAKLANEWRLTRP